MGKHVSLAHEKLVSTFLDKTVKVIARVYPPHPTLTEKTYVLDKYGHLAVVGGSRRCAQRYLTRIDHRVPENDGTATFTLWVCELAYYS